MKDQPVLIKGKIRLKDFDPAYTGEVDKEKAKTKSVECQEHIGHLQDLLYANSSHSILLVFQGMDASGKDGSVRHVLMHVNPAGVETANFKVPSTEERAHDYLWRIHKALPRHGNIGVFNRSHYEAVLVERVLKIVPKEIWSRRYDEIVNFERLLVESGVVLLKFYLHLSKAEQACRLKARLSDPRKNWKFSTDDLKTREHWREYMKAYEDVLNKTSHEQARWHLIPADHKWYRDYLIARTVVRAMEDLKLKWPKPKEDLSKIRIV